MNLALVHDWLNQRGGAEDVLEVLVSLYPNSPIFTSIYAPDLMPEAYHRWDIRPQWINYLPGINDHQKVYLPVYPAAWGTLNLSAYDVVLSNKSGFAHVFQHDAHTLHICYCLAPTRYVWQPSAYLRREQVNPALVPALRLLLGALRFWDFAASRGVHHFIAISSEVRQRIHAYYRRKSDIIYPPVETERFAPSATVDDYFLVVSRLIPYKRIDLAVEAATRLGVPLKVGGKGRDLEKLEAKAGPTVEFLGYVPDDDLPDLMARAKAFIFPGLEDFGITPVQAQAAGRPVIAFAGGGALDTVIPGKTGELFHQQTVESLMQVMAHFDDTQYHPGTLHAHALKFDRRVFEREITSYVDQAYDAFQYRRAFSWQRPNPVVVD